jgi:hypothetical protein
MVQKIKEKNQEKEKQEMVKMEKNLVMEKIHILMEMMFMEKNQVKMMVKNMKFQLMISINPMNNPMKIQNQLLLVHMLKVKKISLMIGKYTIIII